MGSVPLQDLSTQLAEFSQPGVSFTTKYDSVQVAFSNVSPTQVAQNQEHVLVITLSNEGSVSGGRLEPPTVDISDLLEWSTSEFNGAEVGFRIGELVTEVHQRLICHFSLLAELTTVNSFSHVAQLTWESICGCTYVKAVYSDGVTASIVIDALWPSSGGSIKLSLLEALVGFSPAELQLTVMKVNEQFSLTPSLRAYLQMIRNTLSSVAN